MHTQHAIVGEPQENPFKIKKENRRHTESLVHSNFDTHQAHVASSLNRCQSHFLKAVFHNMALPLESWLHSLCHLSHPSFSIGSCLCLQLDQLSLNFLVLYKIFLKHGVWGQKYTHRCRWTPVTSSVEIVHRSPNTCFYFSLPLSLSSKASKSRGIFMYQFIIHFLDHAANTDHFEISPSLLWAPVRLLWAKPLRFLETLKILGSFFSERFCEIWPWILLRY